MLPRPRRPRRGAPRAAVAGPGRRQRTAGAGVPAPKGTPWARSPSPPPPPVAPRVSVPGPPHSAAGGPREGGGGCAGGGARDRPPRPAGADHGRDCGGGACAQLLVSLRLAFRLRLRLLAAGAAAAARTSEPHRLKMAARRLPLLPPGAGSDDTAASRSPANQRGRGSRPATVARRDLVLPQAPGAALGREGLAGPTGPGGRQVPSVQSTRAPPKEPAKALGGGLSAITGLAFTVLTEGLLCGKAAPDRAAPNRVPAAMIRPGRRGGAGPLHHRR